MAAALSVSGCNRESTCTVTLTGDTATTARTLNITDPNGHTQIIPFTTNGSGGMTITFVPQVAGKYTITEFATTFTQVATTSVNSSHP